MENIIINVMKAIILYEKKALIVKRTENNKIGAGIGEFVGGKLEFGEDLISGLKREIMEETGLEVMVEKLLFATSFKTHDYSMIILLLKQNVLSFLWRRKVKKNKFFIIIFLTGITCLILFINQNKKIEICEFNNIKEKNFNKLWDQFSITNDIDDRTLIYLNSYNFNFTFDNDFNIKKFICSIGIEKNKKIISYQLTLNKNKIYSKRINKETAITIIDMKRLLYNINQIDFEYLLRYLKKGDLYSFSLYPDNSINDKNFRYNIKNFNDSSFFVFDDNQVKKITKDNFLMKQGSILFSLFSMKQNIKNEESESYDPLDKIFVVIPLE
ncbi:MAG: NUDIX domain-containing protein [Anaerocolumna sp.]